jgi:hypothetical protein
LRGARFGFFAFGFRFGFLSLRGLAFARPLGSLGDGGFVHPLDDPSRRRRRGVPSFTMRV